MPQPGWERALEIGNERRMAIAAMLRDLRQLHPADALETAADFLVNFSEEESVTYGSLKVMRFLCAIPRINETTAFIFANKSQTNPQRRLNSLTPQARQRLAEILRADAKRRRRHARTGWNKPATTTTESRA
jgi:hypothetical protein